MSDAADAALVRRARHFDSLFSLLDGSDQSRNPIADDLVEVPKLNAAIGPVLHCAVTLDRRFCRFSMAEAVEMGWRQF